MTHPSTEPGPDGRPAEPSTEQPDASGSDPGLGHAGASHAAAEALGEEPGDGATEPGTADQAEGEDLLGPDLVAARSAVDALTGDLQRLQAEYVNYKRRVDRDRQLVKENATFTVLSALLPVLDDLDRAREHGELEGGFKAIADSLERIVSGLGLLKFGQPGDEFDPRLHEAIMSSPSAEVTTTSAQHVVTAGYRIGDRVVRPAKVTVLEPAT